MGLGLQELCMKPAYAYALMNLDAAPNGSTSTSIGIGDCLEEMGCSFN